MNEFIKFHEIEHNSVVYANQNEIVVIDTSIQLPNRNTSKIYFLNSANVANFYVNETVEKIYANYKLENFILLHSFPSNKPLLLNTNIISLIDSQINKPNTNSKIYLNKFSSLCPFVVYESPDKIFSLIKEGQNNSKP